MSRDYKSDSCPAEMQYFPEKLSSTSNMLLLRTSNFQSAIRSIVPKFKHLGIVFIFISKFLPPPGSKVVLPVLFNPFR